MVVVSVAEGKLRGKSGVDVSNNTYYSFQNVPYAAPPISELRFKAPKPPLSWSGIRDATQEGSECLSKDFITKEMVGSEDCLILNVYTPALPSKIDRDPPLKPVMFFIHGGVFAAGSSKTDIYGPEFLVAEDVVLVTINYRLGLLGFLSLDDPSLGVPGNAGFKDMVMALRWVRRNIVNFSGDPDNVTVFGESAGGVCAHLLMLSPMSKGLLHKVIVQSGCALNKWVFGRRPARLVAKKLGFHSSDDRKLLQFLRSTSAQELLQAQFAVDGDDFIEHEIRHFGAIVERSSDEEPFLSEKPIDIILSGNYNHVPMMIGYNNGDGMSFDALVKPAARDLFFDNLETSVPFDLNLQRGSRVSKEVANKIKEFYFDNEQPNRIKHLAKFYTLVTDTSFLRSIYSATKGHAKTSKYPVYFYRMTLETELNYFKKFSGIKIPGAYHADDLGYLFKSVYAPEIKPGSLEDMARKKFTKLWSNFARHGNPTPDSNDLLLNVTWKPVQLNEFNFLNIAEQLTVEKNPEPKRMALWDEIYAINAAVAAKL